MYEGVPMLAGPVAFISQSGSYGIYLVRQCAAHGIGVSKVISYGNALAMDATDYLEYLEADAATGVICMYIEGVREGGRLTGLVRRINAKKPVVIWKGGVTGPGARAAASHTGALAGDAMVWDAFFRQTGAIRVGSLEEMTDVVLTLLRLGPSSGRRVAVLGNAGGGTNVARGDICAEEGIEAPEPSPQTRAKLLEFISLVNQGVPNPMDVPGVLVDASQLGKAADLLSDDPLVDVIILHIAVGHFDSLSGLSAEAAAALRECIAGLSRDDWGGKPVVVAMQVMDSFSLAGELARQLRELGAVCYPSLRRVCRALSRVAGYYEFLAGG